MKWVESSLILFGISLDVFAVMECKGSVLAKIDKKQLTFLCLIISIWQLFALWIGDFISHSALGIITEHKEKLIGQSLAAAILIGLAISLMIKALRKVILLERRIDHLKIFSVLQVIMIGSVYPVLSGVTIGLLHTDYYPIIIMFVGFSVLCVVFGIYAGYRFGFIHRTKAYAIGASLLGIAGLDVIVRCLLQSI